MNQETANYFMQRMSKYLDNSQMIKLKDTLDESLRQSEDGFLEKMLEKSDKNVCVMNTDDIRGYLSSYQEQNGVGKATVDNVRRNLSSFFKWLEDENYIFKSPLRRIHKIKTTITVRETYADEEFDA